MSASAIVVRITILVDNTANEGLVSEHGFSAWIEAAGRRVLFDTGQGPALASNAERLGIPLEDADTLVLSHGHYDHSGGVPLVIERAPGVRVHCHPAALTPRHAVRDGSSRSIGMPDAALERLRHRRVLWVTQPAEVAPGLGLTGPIPRLSDYEDTGGPFFLDVAGSHRDPIDDDLALWIRTQMGLVVVVGCGHSGLINTLTHAKRLTGGSSIHGVLGGFHLIEAGDSRVERTIAALAEIDPNLIVPCHCTGERAIEKLRLALGQRVRAGAAGMVYTFGLHDRDGSPPIDVKVVCR